MFSLRVQSIIIIIIIRNVRWWGLNIWSNHLCNQVVGRDPHRPALSSLLPFSLLQSPGHREVLPTVRVDFHRREQNPEPILTVGSGGCLASDQRVCSIGFSISTVVELSHPDEL